MKKPESAKVAGMIGKVFKAKREHLGLTQVQLAEKVSMSPQGYWNIEAGVSDPKLSTLLKISWELNIHPSTLFSDPLAHAFAELTGRPDAELVEQLEFIKQGIERDPQGIGLALLEDVISHLKKYGTSWKGI